MRIITDSREQRNQQILESISNHGIPFKVKKLEFGDYSIEGFESDIMIERKRNLTELAANFCTGRKRFENEFVKAKQCNAKIYLLIEDEKGKEKMLLRKELDSNASLTQADRQKKTWRSNFTANSMIASISSWKKKYEFEVIFCSKKESGSIIVNLFKQYLESK
jgi:ERCC4-type nuclease